MGKGWESATLFDCEVSDSCDDIVGTGVELKIVREILRVLEVGGLIFGR